MINKITLQNYKCFEYLELPVAPLTLLTGLNSSGKSSVLQSLSLLNQTITENERSNDLILNGNLVSLGTARDVVNEVGDGRLFRIGIDFLEAECIWEFGLEDRRKSAEIRDSLSVPINKIFWKQVNSSNIEDYWYSKEYNLDELLGKIQNFLPQELEGNPNAHFISNILRKIQYLSAERTGPRDVYPVNNSFESPNVGISGENTPWVLDHFATKVPVAGLLLDDVVPTLQRQVEAWMRKFFPGVRLEVTPVPRTNLVTLGFRMSDSENFHRPQNVGYGLTHVLPIITACLSGDKNSLILIENPESHLHPSGQSLMGEFLARAAACGMQIIVETHSDHVLNGARKAVKNKIIEHEQVAIHYFTPKEDARVVSPMIDKNGNLDSWPEGFFDQFDVDTSSLIGWNDQNDVSAK